jgi:hypothetical protein
MANSLVTPTWITKETARILVNNLKFAGTVNRDYNDQYVQAGAKVGYTVNARLPQRFITTKGQAFQPQAINDQYVPVTITDQANVGISFSSASLTLEVDDYRERYVRPAAEQLANTIDADGLSRLYKDIWQNVGAYGTVPNSNLTYLTGGARLSDAACPVDQRCAMLSPIMQATISNANLTLFNPQGTISEIYRKGQFANDALGFADWYMDQNVATHTTGTFTSSTPIVSSANQSGSTLATSGWASGATSFKAGDLFVIAGVYQVNPQNYTSTGNLQPFVITQDVSDSAGAITFNISPPIIATGALQTVDSLPANNAIVAPVGSTITTTSGTGTMATQQSRQGLLYHGDAFTMVMVDLEMPEGGAIASRVSNTQLKIALRFARQWNIQTDQNAARLDCLYGWKTIRPELACRVLS